MLEENLTWATSEQAGTKFFSFASYWFWSNIPSDNEISGFGSGHVSLLMPPTFWDRVFLRDTISLPGEIVSL